MATYNPKFSITAAPGVTGYLYLALAEASAPNTPVANSGQIAPPHNASRQIQITGLNPVIHIFTLYETDGVATTGTVLANGSIDPATLGVELRTPLFITGGVSEGFDAGTNYYLAPDDYLKGWDYLLEIRGQGTLDPATEYTVDADNNPYISQPGYQIQNDEKWVIKFSPKIVVLNPTANSGGNLIGSTTVLTTDADLTVDDMGNLYILSSETSTIKIVLPSLATVTANKLIMFISEGGSHVNAVLEGFDTGSGLDVIDYMNQERTDIKLGQSEQIWFFKWVDPTDNTNIRWKVLNPSDTIKLVGEKVYSDHYLDANLLNCIYADGRELDRVVYARLWEYVQTLPAEMLVTEEVWNTATNGVYTNRSKYSQGDGSTTFRIPIFYNEGFLRGVNQATRKALSYEALQILDHQHITPSGGLNDLGGQGYGKTLLDYFVGLFTGPSNGKRDITSRPIANGSQSPTYIGGTENRPSNTAQYILIRI